MRTDRFARRRRHLAAAASAGLLLLAGCGQNYSAPVAPDIGVASPGVGTVAGAAGGAAIGRAIAGSNNNVVAILAGAALGGLAGNIGLDRPAEARQQREAEAAEVRRQQQQLDFERQSELQRAQTEQEIRERQLFEEWKAGRGGQATAAVPAGASDTVTAQRLLTALGYYRGPIDGVVGPQTRSAVMQFEAAQGLPQTGVVTPSLVGRMRQALV
jgi:hypothetical protein